MGIFSALAGWDYLFRGRPAQDAQQSARRATLEQFQTYPRNRTEGAGVLITQNGVVGGKYWRVTQPPQVFARLQGPTENMGGAGVDFAGLSTASLIPNKRTPSSNL